MVGNSSSGGALIRQAREALRDAGKEHMGVQLTRAREGRIAASVIQVTANHLQRYISRQHER